MNNIVSLRALDNYNLNKVEDIVRECFADIRIDKLLRNKEKAMIKVCLPTSSVPDKAYTTHPSVVAGVINVLTDFGVQCVVADSPYKEFTDSKLENLYLNTGMIEVANSSNCTLNRNLGVTNIETPNGIQSKSLLLIDAINDCDVIINIAKMKIDSQLGYIGACANMFGLVPGKIKSRILNRIEDVKNFNNYIIDIIDCVQDKLVLNIIDAVVALESNNTPRMLSCLAMSENPYSLDACMFNIIGADMNNTIIKQATKREKIDIDNPYKVVGEKIEDFKVDDFALPNIDESSKINAKHKLRNKLYYYNNQQRVVIDGKKCKGCGVCSKICPSNAIMMKYDSKGELYANVDYKKCIYCNKCYTACPYSVIKIKTPFGYKSEQKKLNKHTEIKEK